MVSAVSGELSLDDPELPEPDVPSLDLVDLVDSWLQLRLLFAILLGDGEEVVMGNFLSQE